jgi:hypothetical protein
MIKQYGGKDKYIKMLKSKLAKLEATELDEAIKSWEVIVIKPVNKLKKNQKVVVKAANTATAIKKAAKLFKIDDKLITGKVDVKLEESTLNYARTLKAIEKERKTKNISDEDKETLGKIAKLMASLK